LDEDNPGQQLKGIEFTFIELRKFKPSNTSEKRLHDLWLRFLTEINKGTYSVPEDLLFEADIKEAVDYAQIMGFSKEELATYDRLFNSRMAEVMLVTDSREEGKEEAQKNIALNLLKSGVATEIIAKSTGLNIDEINNLTQ
jgi:predicted transposase/invertase (TIGR01784 family)